MVALRNMSKDVTWKAGQTLRTALISAKIRGVNSEPRYASLLYLKRVLQGRPRLPIRYKPCDCRGMPIKYPYVSRYKLDLMGDKATIFSAHNTNALGFSTIVTSHELAGTVQNRGRTASMSRMIFQNVNLSVNQEDIVLHMSPWNGPGCWVFAVKLMRGLQKHCSCRALRCLAWLYRESLPTCKLPNRHNDVQQAEATCQLHLPNQEG